MMNIPPEMSNRYMTEVLNDDDFDRISKYVGDTYGINLPRSKKYLVQSRLKRRLRDLELPTFKAYCTFLFSEKGLNERKIKLINAISTNKTEFFREKVHFEFLENNLLPVLCSNNVPRGIKLLSAGCASGEEAYSLAMTLANYLSLHRLTLPYMVYGMDVSNRVLAKAQNGIYPCSKAGEIPHSLLHQFVMKSKNQAKPEIRVAPEIRAHTSFFRCNLMDDTYALDHDLDVIFCRNTLIYFEKHNQEAIVRKLLQHLKPGGYFFVGHSESLIHMNLKIDQLQPTIYQK